MNHGSCLTSSLPRVMEHNLLYVLRYYPASWKKWTVAFGEKLHQIFIGILHFNEVTVDVVEVEAARESLVIGAT